MRLKDQCLPGRGGNEERAEYVKGEGFRGAIKLFCMII